MEEINYFDFINSAWNFISKSNLSPTHRALYFSIVQEWNYNFRNEFSADREKLMLLSGIKSNKTYFSCLSDIVEAGLITYQQGKNHRQKSVLSCVNISQVEDSTCVKCSQVNSTQVNSTQVDSTQVEDFYLGKIYTSLYKDTERLVNTESNYIKKENKENIVLKEKKEKKEKSKNQNLKFLDSDIGNFDDFIFYVHNSEYSDADPDFYYKSMRDWIDKQTGDFAKRTNWKLVFNQFIRNDIRSNGKYKTSNNRKPKAELQRELAELDNAVDKLATLFGD